MSKSLPEPEPAVGQRLPREDVDMLVAAVDEAIVRKPTRYRDDSENPAFGDSPPVAQPGRAAQSQQAVDASVVLIAGGFFCLCLGAAVCGVMYFSRAANETVVFTLCAAPSVVLLSLGALVKKIKKVAPEQHHYHYNAPVQQDMRRSSTRGVWARTNNK